MQCLCILRNKGTKQFPSGSRLFAAIIPPDHELTITSGARIMPEGPQQSRRTVLHQQMTEFWSGDLGLTLVTISLLVLIFISVPLAKAGLYVRLVFDLIMVTLMISGALVISQNRIAKAVVIVFVFVSVAVLTAGRFHPTPFLHQFGSVLSTVTLLLYVRIVLLLMFRGGPVTWSRIQGGVSAYLLLGMAWASAYQFAEHLHPGAFHFVFPPDGVDQLTSKLIYFSFSTLSTVGFGDVTPTSPFARSLSISEAITGQLFPAILIGALVAMAMQPRTKT
jgi:hypothetical protein